MIGMIRFLLIAAFVFTFILQITPAFALEDTDFWKEVRVYWGQYATPENVTFLKADVTCDGKEDYIGSRINLDNPDGPFFDVMLVSKNGNEIYSEGQSIPYTGSSEQFGICGEPGASDDPEVFAEKWEQQDIDEIIQMDVCHTPIGVSDGMCDIVYFFWHQSSEQNQESRLVFFRN